MAPASIPAEEIVEQYCVPCECEKAIKLWDCLLWQTPGTGTASTNLFVIQKKTFSHKLLLLLYFL
jgi:hypothetical protein